MRASAILLALLLLLAACSGDVAREIATPYPRDRERPLDAAWRRARQLPGPRQQLPSYRPTEPIPWDD